MTLKELVENKAMCMTNTILELVLAIWAVILCYLLLLAHRDIKRLERRLEQEPAGVFQLSNLRDAQAVR